MLQSIFVGIIVIVALVYSAHCIYKVLKHAGSSCYNCPIKDACNNRNKEKNNNLKSYTFAGGAFEIVQRYGSSRKEHLVAYSGIDNEAV